MTKPRPPAPPSEKPKKLTAAQRIAELEATVAEHERQIEYLGDILRKVEVNAVMTVNAFRHLVELQAGPNPPPMRMKPAEIAPHLYPEPRKKAPAKMDNNRSARRAK